MFSLNICKTCMHLWHVTRANEYVLGRFFELIPLVFLHSVFPWINTPTANISMKIHCCCVGSTADRKWVIRELLCWRARSNCLLLSQKKKGIKTEKNEKNKQTATRCKCVFPFPVVRVFWLCKSLEGSQPESAGSTCRTNLLYSLLPLVLYHVFCLQNFYFQVLMIILL